MMDEDEYPKKIGKLEIKMRNYVNENHPPRRHAYEMKATFGASLSERDRPDGRNNARI